MTQLAQPDGRDREQDRRRRHASPRPTGAGRARRLHLPDPPQRHGDRTGAVPQAPYNPLTDFEYVTQVIDVPMTLLGRKDLPAKDFNELLAYLKANGDKVNLAHAGLGAVSHLCGMLFRQAIGVKLTTVPYQGTGPAMNALLGGQVDLLCDQTTSTTQHIKAGAVKLYGVTTAGRLKTLPETPTLSEQGLKGFEVVVWHGIYAPKGTPKEAIDKFGAALKAALKDPVVAQRLDDLGAVVVPRDQADAGGPADLAAAGDRALRARSSRRRVSSPTDHGSRDGAPAELRTESRRSRHEPASPRRRGACCSFPATAPTGSRRRCAAAPTRRPRPGRQRAAGATGRGANAVSPSWPRAHARACRWLLRINAGPVHRRCEDDLAVARPASPRRAGDDAAEGGVRRRTSPRCTPRCRRPAPAPDRIASPALSRLHELAGGARRAAAGDRRLDFMADAGHRRAPSTSANWCRCASRWRWPRACTAGPRGARRDRADRRVRRRPKTSAARCALALGAQPRASIRSHLPSSTRPWRRARPS